MGSEIHGYRSGPNHGSQDFSGNRRADSENPENSDCGARSDPGPVPRNAAFFTIDDLPKFGTTRWVIRRKARIVTAVQSGLLTIEEACSRYGLSREEYLSWQRLIGDHGLQGLRVTRLQDYRGPCRADNEPSSKQRAADSAINPTE